MFAVNLGGILIRLAEGENVRFSERPPEKRHASGAAALDPAIVNRKSRVTGTVCHPGMALRRALRLIGIETTTTTASRSCAAGWGTAASVRYSQPNVEIGSC